MLADPLPVATPRSKSLLAGGAVCVTLLVGWLAYSAYYARHPDVPFDAGRATGMFDHPRQLNTYLLRFVPTADATGQKLAHRAMLLGLGALMALASFWPRRWEPAVRPLAGLCAVLVVGGGLVFAHFWTNRPVDWRIVGLGALVPLALGALGPLWAWRPVNRLFAMLTLVVLAALTVPGLFVRLDLSFHPWSSIEIIQAHYAYVFSQGDRLAAGARLAEDVVPYYGLLTPLVTGAAQRWLGDLSLHAYMRMIEFLQAVYILAALYVYHYHARRKWVLCLAITFFALLTYHFYQFYLNSGTPNHTAWRAIAFPVALAVLVRVRKLPLPRSAFVLGLTACLAVLQNAETGLAVTAGLLTFVAVHHPPAHEFRPWLCSAARTAFAFATGVLVTGVGYVVVYRLLLGEWLEPRALAGVFQYMRLMADHGLGSTRLAFHPLAVLMFVHAAYVLIRVWLDRRRVGRFRPSFRAAAAAMILTWFAYYANRPDPEYLTSFHVLYGVLLLDLLRPLLVVSRRRALWAPALGALAVLTLVVVPAAIGQTAAAWEWYVKGVHVLRNRPDDRIATRLSGVYFPNERRAAELWVKARFLKSLDRSRPVIYLTVDSYLIPKVSGVWPALPLVDVFWESLTPRQYAKLLRRIVASGVDVIYFDSDESIASYRTPLHPPLPPLPGSREFFRELRKDLAPHFERSEVTSGWEVWKRRG